MRIKGFILITTIVFLASCSSETRSTYELTSPQTSKEIKSGHLNMGVPGKIDVNSYYMSLDGKPAIPVLGEFHFSRYPQEQWEEEILKIKAGGITILPTYVFWAIHEEREGVFDWSGNKNLRHFLELCKKHDMPVIIRIGPFCHGEIRNGAIPDWIFAKPIDVRSNDPLYLHYVDRLYGEIAKQMEGLYFKDGGPIIGCQLENEHQHSAAPWGINYIGEPVDNTTATYDSDFAKIGVSVQEKKITTEELGNEHMRTLKAMAEKHGIITPIYTATGWGNAAVIGNEAIPVTSAYTYPFWVEPAMSEFCKFKDIHKHPDYEPVRYIPTDFPSFCVEMGAGIQMTYKRRPIVPGLASEALMVRTLGSGSNGIGYYMYHGGSTPKMEGGVGTFADEAMGMPKVSYDFQAPIGEFGLEGTMYRNLRLLHLFLADFGSQLAPMETVLPENWETITPENRKDLRYCARMKDNRGFIFMVNFQDHDQERYNQEGLKIKLNLNGETLCIPAEGSFTLPKDQSVIIPFNLDMSGTLLKYATAQLLMKIPDNGKEHYFFFAREGMKVEYAFEDKTVVIDTPGIESTFEKGNIKITTLTREQALDATKFGNQIIITKALAIEPQKGSIQLFSLGKNEFEYILYPSNAGFKTQVVNVPEVQPVFSWEKYNSRRITVHFTDKPSKNVSEYYLKLDYVGDVAMAFLENTMINDHFWSGKPWLIGLNRMTDRMQKEDLGFYIRPLNKDSQFLIDIDERDLPEFNQNGQALSINYVEIIPQYTITI